MFNPPHLAFILLTAILAPIIGWYLRKLSKSALTQVMSALVVIALCFDPAYWLWEWLTYHEFNWARTFPLYICSLFWLLMPFAVHAKSDGLRQMARANISSVGLISGILGLVFNTYISQYGFWHFVPIRSLLYHFMMITVSIAFWMTGYYQPKRGDSLKSLLPVYVLLVPCITLSYLFGWDYAFTAGGIGTPLEAWSSAMPRPLYLLSLYGTASAVICLFYVAMRQLVTQKHSEDITVHTALDTATSTNTA